MAHLISIIHENYNGGCDNVTFDFKGNLSITDDYRKQFTQTKRNKKLDCYLISFDKIKNEHTIANSYFVGVDWIVEREHAIYIEPKLNKGGSQTNYLEMLFSALEHPEISRCTEDLFEIKWNEPQVEISQQQDLLTPLLVVQFLTVVKEIVRKGLKKSYYKVESNLYGKMKGKVMISQTIKKNLLKNKPLNMYCSYDEFGLNGLENRLLKKALLYVNRYLPQLKIPNSGDYTTDLFNYINPAFEFVSEDVEVNDIKHIKTNAFYKEYAEGLRLAKLILKRFGYNITNALTETIKTPPFWIDMSKLFELYVLGLLKKQFGSQIIYHPAYKSKELDYLLLNPPMVIDAKYKPRYIHTSVLDDARQLSGYSRMHKVYDTLNYPKDKIIDCLIIYPNQESNIKDLSKFSELIQDPKSVINEYVNFFKIGIEIPVIK